MEKTEILRGLFKQPKIIVTPHAYDAFSAKIMEHLGFKVIHISGAGVSASLLGEPDVGFATMTEMVNQARYIASAVNLPVMADADTGYGNAMNVMRTVKEFERAGVAAMRIEDQEAPKRCGHLEGKKLITKEEMVGKLKAAFDARQDENFVIGVRCDARAVYGLEDALERGHAYVEAGADYLSIEAPETMDDLRKITEAFNIPLYLNMTKKKTPNISVTEAEKLGFKIIGFPFAAISAAGKALFDTLKLLRETGNEESIEDRMLSLDELYESVGLKKYFEKEVKFLR